MAFHNAATVQLLTSIYAFYFTFLQINSNRNAFRFGNAVRRFFDIPA